MLRAVALVVGLCAVFGLVLYVYYSGDTVRTTEWPTASTQFEANYRALAKLTRIDFSFVNPQAGWLVTGTSGTAGFESGVFRTMDGGTSWQEAKLPSEIASSPVALLGAKDERTSWLSFCPQVDCAQRALAVTFDGGVAWKSLGSP